ncbi:dermonecrotic toxin SPH-like isoform X1 [Dermacentor variabilis]|uniref:dermonecrotic toxin SPH-like isoform X1 n=1 Tax=Dermacentor variabilis TaxID=34621 RepID=UPI003F5C5A4D
MAVPHFSRHRFTRMIAYITLLHVTNSEEAERRPFFIIGHMANSIADAETLMTKGANSLEVDVRFASNGTASRAYHGFPCDCLRECDGETTFTDYLDYIHSVTSVDGAKYKDKLLLLYLDLKTSDIADNRKYDAGTDVANKLIQHLWVNVSDTTALNVLLYVSSTDDSELFHGALDTLAKQEDAEHWMRLVGFDFGTYRHPDEISKAFVQLGINGQCWQGGGITNCLVDFLGNFQLPGIVAARDVDGYVDKAYAWTVDDPPTITRFIKIGIDGMITNRPDNVLKVIGKSEIAPLVRPAGPDDSPWSRIRVKS